MTVWPMETVSAVGRLRVMGYESREVYARFIDDARRLLRDRLARSLVDAARTHGVEIDPRDTVMARHAERIKNLDIKNLDVLDSNVRWS